MQLLPLDAQFPRYRVTTSLGEKLYIFDMHWNARAESWYFDLLREDTTPIRQGVRLVLGTFLAGRSVDADFPPGRMMACDLSGEGREATIDDLGTRVVVYYIPLEDLA